MHTQTIVAMHLDVELARVCGQSSMSGLRQEGEGVSQTRPCRKNKARPGAAVCNASPGFHVRQFPGNRLATPSAESGVGGFVRCLGRIVVSLV